MKIDNELRCDGCCGEIKRTDRVHVGKYKLASGSDKEYVLHAKESCLLGFMESFLFFTEEDAGDAEDIKDLRESEGWKDASEPDEPDYYHAMVEERMLAHAEARGLI